MKQEDYNAIMRTPAEAYAERNKPPRKFPKCPSCGEEYLGDGGLPCLDCEYNVEISNNDKLN